MRIKKTVSFLLIVKRRVFEFDGTIEEFKKFDFINSMNVIKEKDIKLNNKVLDSLCKSLERIKDSQ